MRLHPVEDGLIPLPDERGMRKFDRSGNRLRDINDPQTGFCITARSPLDSDSSVITPSPVNGAETATTKQYRQYNGRYVDVSELHTDDPDVEYGLVVRLTTDGDDPLPITRVRIAKLQMSDSDNKSKK